MTKTRVQLEGEIRYAIVLSERTARLYRRMQTVGTFLSIVGLSAVLTSVLSSWSDAARLGAAAVFLLSTAAILAVKPAEKVVRWEQDIQRYRTLMARCKTMTLEQIEQAIQIAHQDDAPEIEPLRDVAYNQLVVEMGQPSYAVKLTPHQRFFAMLG